MVAPGSVAGHGTIPLSTTSDFALKGGDGSDTPLQVGGAVVFVYGFGVAAQFDESRPDTSLTKQGHPYVQALTVEVSSGYSFRISSRAADIEAL